MGETYKKTVFYNCINKLGYLFNKGGKFPPLINVKEETIACLL